VAERLVEESLEETQLNARLQSAPVVVVEGVMGDLVTTRSGRDTLWTISMTLEVWREESGELRREPLCLTRQVDDAVLERYESAVPGDYCLVRVAARLVMDPDVSGPQGLMEGIPQVIADEELAGQAARLQLPVSCEDPLFGLCRLNRHRGSFVAEALWNDCRIDVILEAATLEALPPVLEQARALWRDQARCHALVLDRAMDALLELKNDDWLEEGEAPVSADAFRQRLRLQSITLAHDGSFEFCFGDDDLFWGHSIMVRGTVKDGPEIASLAG